MCNILQVRWTILPQTAPQPWLTCNGCGNQRPFKSSGKLRLNANGKKLDAWLIYKCTFCDKTWNRSIFERRNRRDFAPEVLDALQANDPSWVDRYAFDIDGLRRKARRIDEFSDCEARKAVIQHCEEPASLEILLAAPLPTAMRLDRLLASELDLSRGRIQALHEASKLRIEPAVSHPLRRPPADGSRLTIKLAAEPDRSAIANLACGACANH